MTDADELAVDRKEAELKARYGELITAGDLAEIFRYPSREAVLKAHARGALPVSMARFPRRRGWFATPRSVARCLTALEIASQAAHGGA